MIKTFGIYAAVCTVLFIIYMGIMITRDVFGKDDKKKDSDDEVFDNSGIADFSQSVSEGGDKGYEIKEDEAPRDEDEGSKDTESGGDGGSPEDPSFQQPEEGTVGVHAPEFVPETVQEPVPEPEQPKEQTADEYVNHVQEIADNDMDVIRVKYQDEYNPTAFAVMMQKPRSQSRIFSEVVNI